MLDKDRLAAGVGVPKVRTGAVVVAAALPSDAALGVEEVNEKPVLTGAAAAVLATVDAPKENAGAEVVGAEVVAVAAPVEPTAADGKAKLVSAGVALVDAGAGARTG